MNFDVSPRLPFDGSLLSEAGVDLPDLYCVSSAITTSMDVFSRSRAWSALGDSVLVKELVGQYDFDEVAARQMCMLLSVVGRSSV